MGKSFACGSTSDQFETNTGGRYNPTTDSWTPITTAGAPAGRYDHVSVWTGGEMIVWGGKQGSTYPAVGGRYDPGADSWMPMTLDQSPDGRFEHSGVWSGREMLIFGGTKLNPAPLGGRYCAASCTSTDWFRDDDNDGVGDPGDVVSACTAPDGYDNDRLERTCRPRCE